MTDKKLKKTLFLADLNIGSVYSDYDTIEKIIESSDAKKLIVGGSIYPTHQFYEQKRRRLKDPKFPTLGDRVKKYANMLSKFDGEKHHVLGETDRENIWELFRQYRNTVKLLKEDDDSWSVYEENVKLLNEDLDEVQDIIAKQVYPYILETGIDHTHFKSRNEPSEQLINLINGFKEKNIKRKGKVTKVTDTYKQGNVLVRDNFNFSDVTQYVNPQKGIEEFVKKINNGTVDLDGIDFIVDTRQNTQMLKVMEDKAYVLVPGGSDDRKYYDPEVLTTRKKRTLQDRTHKRATIRKRLNLPGGWEIEGSPDYFMRVKPFYPKVLDNMEKAEKQGGFDKRQLFLFHDIQLGSITEDLESMVKALDYATVERKSDIFAGIGDFIQGRNYREMPNENQFLGDITVDGQIKSLSRLIMPYLTGIGMSDEQRKNLSWKDYVFVPGNHEWNTDRNHQGMNFLTTLEGRIEQHLEESGRDANLIAPRFFRDKSGNVIYSPFAGMSVNNYDVMMSHMFSQWGSGKGNSNNPTTHLMSWNNEMGENAEPFDMYLAGHYHIIEMMVQDNAFMGILGAYATESGYEWARQYGGAKSRGSIITFDEDGSFTVDVFTDKFLKDWKVKHKNVKDLGIDDYIQNCVNEEIYDMYSENRTGKKMYVRGFNKKDYKEK